MEKNMVDPERIVEDLHRRSLQKYKGELLYKFDLGEIINIREKYIIDLPFDNILEQWNECFKHVAGLSKVDAYGKVCVFLSYFKGDVKKMEVDRSLPMQKFWYYEKKG